MVRNQILINLKSYVFCDFFFKLANGTKELMICMVKVLNFFIFVHGATKCWARLPKTNCASTSDGHTVITDCANRHLSNNIDHAVHLYHIYFLPRTTRRACKRFLVGCLLHWLIIWVQALIQTEASILEDHLVATGHANHMTAIQGAWESLMNVHEVMAIWTLVLLVVTLFHRVTKI